MSTNPACAPLVALFATCLVNSQRPTVGFATVKLLEQAGFRVEVPPDQTCCGQPPYNNGLTDDARRIARWQIQVLEPYDWIVVPSGSCAGMIGIHYCHLFDHDERWRERARRLAGKTRELAAFLAEQGVRFAPSPGMPAAATAHHTSCSCRRETRSHTQADDLLRDCLQDRLKPFAEAEACCGFGGTFSAKFDALSARMGSQKLDSIEAAGARTVASADLGCLLHLQGLALRQQRDLQFRHLAEVLADAEPQGGHPPP